MSSSSSHTEQLNHQPLASTPPQLQSPLQVIITHRLCIVVSLAEPGLAQDTRP
jgi:hypothetical protein